MATHARPAVGPRSDSLDIARKPLKIQSLDDTRTATPDPHLVERVRGEFNEMPGFSPTLEQLARLFSLPKEECARIVTVLLGEGFLYQSSGGRYQLCHR
jgi:hypothetical protein